MPTKKPTKAVKSTSKAAAPKLFKPKVNVFVEHRNFLAVLVLFVGFSLYSITSFMVANNNSIKKMFANVLASDQSVEQQSTQNPFSDLTASNSHYTAIISLYNKGVIGGFPDNTFRPDNKVTRAEFSKMLIESADVDYSAFPAANMSNCFSDVGDVPADWFAPSVCAAKYEGYVQGGADGQFAPNQNIHKAEGLKIIMKAFGFAVPANEAVTVMPYTDVQPADWFVGVAQAVKDSGVDSKSTIFSPAWELTRGDVAQLIFNAMNLKKIAK